MHYKLNALHVSALLFSYCAAVSLRLHHELRANGPNPQDADDDQYDVLWRGLQSEQCRTSLRAEMLATQKPTPDVCLTCMWTWERYRNQHVLSREGTADGDEFCRYLVVPYLQIYLLEEMDAPQNPAHLVKACKDIYRQVNAARLSGDEFFEHESFKMCSRYKLPPEFRLYAPDGVRTDIFFPLNPISRPSRTLCMYTGHCTSLYVRAEADPCITTCSTADESALIVVNFNRFKLVNFGTSKWWLPFLHRKNSVLCTSYQHETACVCAQGCRWHRGKQCIDSKVRLDRTGSDRKKDLLLYHQSFEKCIEMRKESLPQPSFIHKLQEAAKRLDNGYLNINISVEKLWRILRAMDKVGSDCIMYKNGYEVNNIRESVPKFYDWPFFTKEGEYYKYRHLPAGRNAKEMYCYGLPPLPVGKEAGTLLSPSEGDAPAEETSDCSFPSYGKPECQSKVYQCAAAMRPTYGCINSRRIESGCRPPYDYTYGRVVFKFPEKVRKYTLMWPSDSMKAGRLMLFSNARVGYSPDGKKAPQRGAYNYVWNGVSAPDTTVRCLDWLQGEYDKLQTISQSSRLNTASTIENIMSPNQLKKALAEFVSFKTLHLDEAGSLPDDKIGSIGPINYDAEILFKTHTFEDAHYNFEHRVVVKYHDDCSDAPMMPYVGCFVEYKNVKNGRTVCSYIRAIYCNRPIDGKAPLENGELEFVQSGITGFQVMSYVSNRLHKKRKAHLYSSQREIFQGKPIVHKVEAPALNPMEESSNFANMDTLQFFLWLWLDQEGTFPDDKFSLKSTTAPPSRQRLLQVLEQLDEKYWALGTIRSKFATIEDKADAQDTVKNSDTVFRSFILDLQKAANRATPEDKERVFREAKMPWDAGGRDMGSTSTSTKATDITSTSTVA